MLIERLGEMPAVVLLGPRQTGKTTLAHEVARRTDSIYLDLESEKDRAKLAEPELYLERYTGKLVIIDEIHRMPGLFGVLRGIIDRTRLAGGGRGMYLLLGSASMDLLRQSGETLAGRVSYLELAPFCIGEVGSDAGRMDELWVRGGFPDSFLARSGVASFRWRSDFIRSYLERDIPQLRPRIPAERLRRLWIMLAHDQGGMLNISRLAGNIGVDVRTASHYVDLLADLLLVRRLLPWASNTGKRLRKSPKVYVRDSGLVHALLSIGDREALLSHPVVGQSWEGFVIEQLIESCPAGTQPFFYRTGGGAEIDLLLDLPGGVLWAVEVKRSMAPGPGRGFHSACADLSPTGRFIVYPGSERYPLAEGIDAIPLPVLAGMLSESG
ncbi:MAG: ATP-binding protein [Candidatus Fermentibacter sp.]|nr:ATP-binding protein [Candidatus Fermentibacter sp.]